MNVIQLASHARTAANTLPTPSQSAVPADLVVLHMQAVNGLSAALRHLPPMSDYLSLPPEIVDNPQRSAIHDKKSIFQRV
jgi:hypothetical protein